MRLLSPIKIVILSILLACAAYVVHGPLASGSTVTVKVPLREILDNVNGWNTSSNQLLSDEIVNGLKLDDYIFRSYTKGPETVSLYIGYYRTAAKVGAAHDPLVCFSGQGWRTGNSTEGTYRLSSMSGLTISYSSMIAERNGEREIIVYWFQANGTTSSSTLRQKLEMVRDRIKGGGEENAFVRITSPVGHGTPEAARQRIHVFIESFYPHFHRYVTGTRS